MRILLTIFAILVSNNILANIFFVNISPISFEEIDKDHYRFIFTNHGLEWLPEPDTREHVVLHIRYRPECLTDNAIHFGLENDPEIRYQNYLAAVAKLRDQLGTIDGKLIFGFDANKLKTGEYVTENLRVHRHMKQNEVVWAVGSNFLKKHCSGM